MTSLRNLLEKDRFHRISLKKLHTGHYKLSLKVNQTKGDFILDTGASTSCIGQESAWLFGLTSEESDVKAAGAGASNMNTYVGKGATITIGDITLSNRNVIIFDLQHVNDALKQVDEPNIHGILGADILKELRAVIDYGRNCFYIKSQ